MNKLEIVRSRVTLPQMRRSMRVVAVADVHAPSFSIPIPELVRIINEESPDLFILAGDIIDKHGREELVGCLNVVEANFAKLAVLGNWEYLSRLDLTKLEKEYNGAGITLLVNRAVEIEGLHVVGLDDFLFGTPDFALMDRLTIGVEPVMVVSHCPEAFDFLRTLSLPSLFVLAGHTHGGQIALFGKAIITPKGSGRYVQGWYHRGNSSMYVMRGVGTSGLPFRIGSRPEMLVLDVR